MQLFTSCTEQTLTRFITVELNNKTPQSNLRKALAERYLKPTKYLTTRDKIATCLFAAMNSKTIEKGKNAIGRPLPLKVGIDKITVPIISDFPGLLPNEHTGYFNAEWIYDKSSFEKYQTI
jgi:hypothetical protein